MKFNKFINKFSYSIYLFLLNFNWFDKKDDQVHDNILSFLDLGFIQLPPNA